MINSTTPGMPVTATNVATGLHRSKASDLVLDGTAVRWPSHGDEITDGTLYIRGPAPSGRMPRDDTPNAARTTLRIHTVEVS